MPVTKVISSFQLVSFDKIIRSSIGVVQNAALHLKNSISYYKMWYDLVIKTL
jgi:hypothetical protein